MAGFYQPEGFFVTTLSADINASTSTIPLTAVPQRYTTGYLVIEPTSSTKREVMHFTSVGVSSVTTADDTTDASDTTGRGCLGSITQGANTTHSQGVTVVIAAVEQYWDRIFDALGQVVDSSTGLIKSGLVLTLPQINDTSSDHQYIFAVNELAADRTVTLPLLTGNDTFLFASFAAEMANKTHNGDFGLVGATDNIKVNSADPKRGFYVPAVGMYGATTNGAASGQIESSTNKINTKVLDFDGTTEEYAWFALPSPDYWDLSTITVKFHWTAASGTGDVIWGAAAVALSNDDAIDTALGTAVTVTDTLITANDVHTTSATSAITVGGTPAKGDYLFVRIYRDADAGGDTLNGVDARLLGVTIKFGIGQYDDQ